LISNALYFLVFFPNSSSVSLDNQKLQDTINAEYVSSVPSVNNSFGIASRLNNQNNFTYYQDGSVVYQATILNSYVPIGARPNISVFAALPFISSKNSTHLDMTVPFKFYSAQYQSQAQNSLMLPLLTRNALISVSIGGFSDVSDPSISFGNQIWGNDILLGVLYLHITINGDNTVIPCIYKIDFNYLGIEMVQLDRLLFNANSSPGIALSDYSIQLQEVVNNYVVNLIFRQSRILEETIGPEYQIASVLASYIIQQETLTVVSKTYKQTSCSNVVRNGCNYLVFGNRVLYYNMSAMNTQLSLQIVDVNSNDILFDHNIAGNISDGPIAVGGRYLILKPLYQIHRNQQNFRTAIKQTSYIYWTDMSKVNHSLQFYKSRANPLGYRYLQWDFIPQDNGFLTIAMNYTPYVLHNGYDQFVILSHPGTPNVIYATIQSTGVISPVITNFVLVVMLVILWRTRPKEERINELYPKHDDL